MTFARTSILTLGLLAMTAACAAPVHRARSARTQRVARGAQPIGYGGDMIVADGAPPAAIYEALPTQSCGASFYLPGYWDWDGYDWYWIPGHCELAPTGFAWVGPAYTNYGGYCEYHPPHWVEEDRATSESPPPATPRSNGAVTIDRHPPAARIRTPRRTDISVRPNATPATGFQPEATEAPRTVQIDPPATVVRPTVKPSKQLPDLSIDDQPASVFVPQAKQPQRPLVRPHATTPSVLAPSRVQPAPRLNLPPPIVAPSLPSSRMSAPAFTPAPPPATKAWTAPPPAAPPPSVSKPSVSKPNAKPASSGPAFKPSKK